MSEETEEAVSPEIPAEEIQPEIPSEPVNPEPIVPEGEVI